MNHRLRVMIRWWPIAYLAVGIAWLILSHNTLLWMFPERTHAQLLTEAISTLLFLALTAALTFRLMRSEQRSARAALIEAREEVAFANERLAWMSRHADDIILLLDEEGRIVDCNETTERVYGYTRPELLALTVFDLRRPSPAEAVTMHSQFNVVRASGRLVFETEHVRKNGTLVPVEVSSTHITFHGKPYVQSIVRDITARRRLERQNRQIAAERDELLLRFGAQFAAMPLGCVVTDPALNVLMANPAVERIFGYSQQALKSGDVLSLIVPQERREEVEGRIRAYRQSETVETSIGQCRTSDDRRIVCRWLHVPLRDPEGHALGMMYICEDVTTQLVTQKALRDSEARYRDLFQQASDGIFVIDEHEHVVDANPEALRMLGVPAGVAFPLALVDFVVARERIAAPENPGGPPLRRERWDLAQRQGRRLRAEASLRTISDAQTLATLRDQTDLEVARWRERRQHDLHELLTHANDAVTRMTDKASLYEAITRLAVREGKFLFAWLGEARPDGSVDKMARFGRDDGYVDQLEVSTRADEERGLGPTGRSLRDGVPVVTNRFLETVTTNPWHDLAHRVGVQSSATFPLRQAGRVVAMLALYSDEKDFFSRDIVATLEQIAAMVSFGLDALALRQEVAEQPALLRESAAVRSCPENSAQGPAWPCAVDQKWRSRI